MSTLSHRNDPDTSRRAASRAERKQILFSAILQILATRPRTAEATEEAYFELRKSTPNWPKVADYSVHKRISELHKQGRVVDTGERGPTRSGSTAVIWAVA